jgi:hypothetical protein
VGESEVRGGYLLKYKTCYIVSLKCPQEYKIFAVQVGWIYIKVSMLVSNYNTVSTDHLMKHARALTILRDATESESHKVSSR